MRTDLIGVNLFSNQKSPFSPSDGRSEAVITRSPLNFAGGGHSFSVGEKEFHGSFDAPDGHVPFFALRPGESKSIQLTLKLTPGEYQLVVGYGGGVHENRSLASNAVSFDVDKDGKVASTP